MISQPKVSYAPGNIKIGPDDGYDGARLGPLHVMGAVCFPTSDFAVATHFDKSRREATVLTIVAAGDFGMFHTLSPEGARVFATKLIAAADEVDRYTSDHVAEAIEKARRK